MPKMYLKRVKTYNYDPLYHDDTNGPAMIQLSQNYWDPRYPSNYKYGNRKTGTIKFFNCRAKYHCVECYKILPKETNWKTNALLFRKRPIRVIGLRCNDCHKESRQFCIKHLQLKKLCIAQLPYKNAREKLFTLLMHMKRIGIIMPIDLRKMLLEYLMTFYQPSECCEIIKIKR
jgi:hypothetical protein